MCGICGVAYSDNEKLVDRGVLERMRDTLTHRGPDDAGLHIDGAVGLGSRRLSIIDLPGGHQPIANEDGSIWIVFNGEIYNYLELRRDYLASRFRFSTDSDTEVILHLYELFGEDCVHYLNGMFAFAIWDRNKRKLFLARDRFGIKPLYYTVQNNSFIFGSEIKSVLSHPNVSVAVNPKGIDQFITYGYVHTPDTLFSNIYKLPEGHTLTWRSGKMVMRGYWDLDFRPVKQFSEEQHAERVADLLQDSVRLRLRSDVPSGLFLSGGIDSTVVVGLAARNAGNLKTFSIGFDTGKEFNELAYARVAAKKFGTDHHEVVLTQKDFLELFPLFVSHMEEPVTDAAAIPLYCLSMFASRHVKVVLGGEGSDELFAGYPIYHYMNLIEQYRRIPDRLRKILFNRLIVGMWGSKKMDKYVYLSGLPIQRRYLNVNLYDVRLREDIYRPDFRRSLADFDPVDVVQDNYRRTEGWDLLSRLMYLDIKTWLPNDILAKADRMSMAASIELRSPFLDYRLAEYAASVPSNFKLRLGQTKYILRRTFRDLVPKEILRRPKMGFPVPLANMFRGALRPRLEEAVEDTRSTKNGYFNSNFLQRLLGQHFSGQADHHQVLWRVLILEEWQRQFRNGLSIAISFVTAQVFVI
ncbi:MAG TPA: asparagine synthase (glutamine-hydrolyzing) [Terriglobia bacterium]|nr:asparagine synthase (glutamine-hydrolyzing) [Terriglobia bacterium]